MLRIFLAVVNFDQNYVAGAEELIQYFETTYVVGYRRANLANNGVQIQIVRPPIFPPPTWNMHEETIQDGQRTNNICESWNVRWVIMENMPYFSQLHKR